MKKIIKTRYVGNSMKFIFNSLDLLYIFPCNDKSELKKGDIVLFHSPVDKKLVIHRIVEKKKTGVKTQGDNNINKDPWIVPYGEILGKVKFIKRDNNRKTKVYGGKLGNIQGTFFVKFAFIKTHLIKIAKYIYNLLTNLKLFKVTMIKDNFKIVTFERPWGKEEFLFWKKKYIGKKNAQNGKWHLTWKYRLLIKDKSLP